MSGSHKRRRIGAVVLSAVCLTLLSTSIVFLTPGPAAVAPQAQFVAYSSVAVIKDAVFSPDGGRIAFSSNMSGTFQIWSIGPDGRHLTRLTYLSGDSLSPEFSPNGTMIAFYHVDAVSQAVMLMSADGTNAENVSDGASVIDGFQWNPSGNLIAYQEAATGQTQIVVRNLDSGGIDFRANGTAPSWSDDGKLLSFIGRANGKSVLALENLTDNQLRTVCVVSGQVYGPRFSSDSSSIVFMGSVNGTLTIESARISDGQTQNLLQAPTGGLLSQSWIPILGDESAPVPRPRDEAVAFSAGSNPNEEDLFRVIPHTQVVVSAGAFDVFYPGTILDRLTTQGFRAMSVPSWSTDGNQIVFSARDSTGLHDLVVLSYTPPKFVSRYGP